MSDEKIALAIIAGDDAIKQGIAHMIHSIHDQVNGIFISFNGSDSRVYVQLRTLLSTYIDLEYDVAGFEWVDDFASARNHSFDLVPESFDWIFWMDTDDLWDKENKSLQDAIAFARDAKAHAVFMPYAYDYDRETGKALTTHGKERLIRRDARFMWHYPIHENCFGPMSTRSCTFNDARILHDRGETEPKRERNRRIVRKWYEDEGHQEARAVMYMAHETFALAEESEKEEDKIALYKASIKLYQDFTRMSPSGDDTYQCNLMVSDALKKMGRFNDSINIDMQGVKMEPERPAAYISIAVTHIMGGDHKDAVAWAELALSRSGGDPTLHAVETLNADYKPFMILGDAWLNLGDPEKAEQYFDAALAIYPDDYTRSRLAEAAETVKAKRRKDKEAEHGFVSWRRACWGDKPEKSIAFLQWGSIEPWNPELLRNGGLGGTETCIIKLAQTFARNGWRVAIFGSPGTWDDRVDEDGVEWYRAATFHPDEPFTALVALRNPGIFEANLAAKKKILWLHDVTMGPVRYNDEGRDLFREVDEIVCVSNFHAQVTVDAYTQIAGGPDFVQPVVIPNSFSREMWMPDPIDTETRDHTKMIYASSPDRGLPRLLDLWPSIAERVPGASLDIFYGWESIDAIIESGHQTRERLIDFKDKVERKLDWLDSEGYKIIWHGRQSQYVLASHMRAAGVMPYPAAFEETFGLVFAQAITAGMVPVVPKLGALPQILGDLYGDFVIAGSPDAQEYGPRFVDAVVAATKVEAGERFIAERSIPGITWEAAYEAWTQLITEGSAS